MACSSETTVSHCDADPILQKDTAPLLKPVPTKVTVDPPLAGPELGMISTTRARGVRIIGKPPNDVETPSPTSDTVTLLAGFGGSWHCIIVVDRTIACVAFCTPKRQKRSVPKKLLPYTVTDTAVNSGAMLGSIPRTWIGCTTSRASAWDDVSR